MTPAFINRPWRTFNILHLAALALMLACLFTTASVQAQGLMPQLTSDRDVAAAGFFRLSWQTDAQRVELQEATNPGFRNATTSYIGSDRASVISGKPNGSWYYRVRTMEPTIGVWSEPVTVLVAHHDLSRALMFLTMGIIVFVAIVVMIVRGGER